MRISDWSSDLCSSDLWHGDTFDLPPGTEHLASTDICPNQAFARGNALALQFHPEVVGDGFERWLIGHTLELGMADIDVTALRADNERCAPALAAAAAAFLDDLLKKLR